MTPHQETPQFATAEYDGLTDSHPHFVRGLLFGVGGAVLGILLYSAVGIITGLEIGLVSLAVGWIVGKAVVAGSKGRTGRRYQIAALALTYAAVSLSAVPIAIAYMINDPEAFTDEASGDAAPAVTSVAAGATSVAGAAPGDNLPSDDAPVSLASAIGTLALFGLASPLLGLTSPGSIIGLIILGIGLRIAWAITGGTPHAVRETLAGSEGPGGPGDKPTTLNLGR